MALINTNGNYLKITNVDICFDPLPMNTGATVFVRYETYKDETTRINGLGAFDSIVGGRKQFTEFTFYNDQSSLVNNLKKGGYIALKSLPEFADWVDA